MQLPTRADWKKDGGLLASAVGMVLFGYWLRRQHLAFPPRESWDEEHFVRNARHYIEGGLDLNDHPPLGKLLIAGGMKLFGDNTFGWRIVPLWFGLIAIVLAYMLAADLFKSWRAGLIAAALVAVDGFFISYSRAALLDGILTTLILGSAVVLVRATTPARIAGACALIGLAMSIKFTGVVMIVPVLLVTLVLKQAPRWSAAGLILTGLVYYVCFAAGLHLLHMPTGPWAVVRATRGLVNHHLALTEMVHPMTSYWYTWFLPVKPILMRLDETRGWLRAMSTMGNPILWWSGTLAIAGSMLAMGREAVLAIRAKKAGQPVVASAGFFGEHRRAVGLLLLLWVLPLLPWILTRRDSYIYHYLPCYGFILVLLAGMLAWLYERRSTLGLVLLIAVAEVSVFYAPVWGQLPVTPAAYEQRLFLKSWR